MTGTPIDMVARLAAQATGATPPSNPTQAAAMAAANAQPPAGAPKPTGEQPTATENAVSAGAPAEPSPSAMIEVDFNGQKRKFTDAQIRAMTERYGALNHEHAALKPINDLAKRILAATPGATPEQLAGFLAETLAGKKKGDAPATPDKVTAPDEEAIAKWEKENAAAAPPGYREMSASIRTMAAENARLMAMMNQLINNMRGGNVNVTDQANAAIQNNIEAAKRSIGVNLQRAAMQAGVPEDKSEDFMTFAYERGYTPEDFANADLAMRAMADFKANLNTPELERLKAIHQRRQAAAGGIGVTPQAPGGEPANQGDPMMSRIASMAPGQRR